MQGRKLDARWALVVPCIASAAIVLIVVGRSGRTTSSAAFVTEQPAPVSHTSAVLGSRDDRSPRPSPTATLGESIRAADILVKAGKMAPPPTLSETWTAIDELIKAGALPTPPWALDVVPTPTMREILVAADLLVRAGVMAPPPGGNDHAALSAPPQAPAATDTPMAAPPTAVQPTVTPVIPTAVSATSTAVPPTSPAAAVASGPGYNPAYDAAVFAGVNQQRANAGLAPLTIDARLANAAATYAKVLADNNWFSHTGPDGSTLVTRDEAAGFPFTVQIGEVLAWGSNGWSAAEIVQAWMDSPPHHEQIMSGVYTRAGVGCYFSTTNGTPMVRCAMELAGS
jgi:uncharacterized protein YkwD